MMMCGAGGSPSRFFMDKGAKTHLWENRPILQISIITITTNIFFVAGIRLFPGETPPAQKHSRGDATPPAFYFR